MGGATEQLSRPDLLRDLRELPGGRELLSLAGGRDDVELVGGAVRDLLLGCPPRELDVVVGESAAVFARELARELGTLAGQLETSAEHEPSGVHEHERFGTASVILGPARIDIATRRSERYVTPGALPTVAEGTPAQDLGRRDFTVNAVALGLGGVRAGMLRAVDHALEDLEQRRLRVLHERSFAEDPTRLLRLARYAARLGFAIEQGTAEQAAQALAAGALATVSGARLGAELRLALGEADALAALAEFDRLGLLGALHPRLRFERSLAERALALLPADGRTDLLLLALIALPLTLRADGDAGAELRALLDRLQFAAPAREQVVRGAVAVARLVEELPTCASAADLYEAVQATPVEGVALAGALGADDSKLRSAARRWLEEVRHVRLSITGDDLIAAGIAGGPELGRRLHATLIARLAGEVAEGREAELAAALAWTPR